MPFSSKPAFTSKLATALEIIKNATTPVSMKTMVWKVFAHAALRTPPRKTYASTTPQMTSPLIHGAMPASLNIPAVVPCTNLPALMMPMSRYGMMSSTSNTNSTVPRCLESNRSRKNSTCVT